MSRVVAVAKVWKGEGILLEVAGKCVAVKSKCNGRYEVIVRMKNAEAIWSLYKRWQNP